MDWMTRRLLEGREHHIKAATRGRSVLLIDSSGKAFATPLRSVMRRFNRYRRQLGHRMFGVWEHYLAEFLAIADYAMRRGMVCLFTFSSLGQPHLRILPD